MCHYTGLLGVRKDCGEFGTLNPVGQTDINWCELLEV